MEVTFWGTRGSIATPGAGTVRYGGNTACVSVRPRQGPMVILDSGTGIRPLGNALRDRGTTEAVLLLSHGHWDHIQGFPFFAPAYQPAGRLHIMGAGSGTKHLRQIMSDQMDRTYFPVPWEGLQAEIDFTELEEETVAVGSLTVTSFRTIHPGGGLGFRIEEAGKAVVYCTDNELPAPEDPRWARFVHSCRDASLLIHDAQYTEGELLSHTGWGHSSAHQAAMLAHAASASVLALFHHDPQRDDDGMAATLAESNDTVARAASKVRVVAAAEGDVFSF